MKCKQEVKLFCSYFQYKKSLVSATNISSGWINSRCSCYFCCLQHKKSTIVRNKVQLTFCRADVTCAAAAAVTLQEVHGLSELCEIPWRLSRWLERLVVLPCFFTWLLHILQTASKLIRTSPSLQKAKCFHTHSPSPLPSAMQRFVVALRFAFNMSSSTKVLKKTHS